MTTKMKDYEILFKMKQDDWIEACKEIDLLREELNHSKEENVRMRELLRKAKPWVDDYLEIRKHFVVLPHEIRDWLKQYNELMGEEKV